MKVTTNTQCSLFPFSEHLSHSILLTCTTRFVTVDFCSYWGCDWWIEQAWLQVRSQSCSVMIQTVHRSLWCAHKWLYSTLGFNSYTPIALLKAKTKSPSSFVCETSLKLWTVHSKTLEDHPVYNCLTTLKKAVSDSTLAQYSLTYGSPDQVCRTSELGMKSNNPAKVNTLCRTPRKKNKKSNKQCQNTDTKFLIINFWLQVKNFQSPFNFPKIQSQF